jgi:hypothetical protein
VNQGPIWGRLLKKTRGRQSRATVPLNQINIPSKKVNYLIKREE